MSPLDDLIKEAVLNVRPASHGQRPGDHVWIPLDGGRPCPRGGNNSQALYECQLCGILDYGDPPGPGFHDCFDDLDGCEGCLSFEAIENVKESLGAKRWYPLEQYRQISRTRNI